MKQRYERTWHKDMARIQRHKRTCYKTQLPSHKSRRLRNSPTASSSRKRKMEKQPSKYRVVFTSQNAHSEPLCISHLRKQSGMVEERIGLQDTKISCSFTYFSAIPKFCSLTSFIIFSNSNFTLICCKNRNKKSR